jgi:WD40 repeat protein
MNNRWRLLFVMTLVAALPSARGAAPDWVWAAGGNNAFVQRIHFTPGGQQLVTFAEQAIKFWDTNGWKFLREIPFAIRGVTAADLSADGTYAAVGGSYGEPVLILRISDGVVLHTLVTSNNLWSLRFSPDAQWLLMATDDGAQLIEVGSGLTNRTFSADGAYASDAAFSPDGQRIATATGSGLRVWTRDGLLLFAPFFDRAPYRVAFSPDGSKLAASLNNVVRVFDMASGTLLNEFSGHTNFVGAIAWSPDGTRIGSVSGSQAHLWNVASTSIVQTLSTNFTFVEDLTFSPDATRLFIGAFGGVLIWDVTNGEVLGKVEANGDTLQDLTYSADGRWIATVSSTPERRIRLWNATNGEPVSTFIHHTNAVRLALSPDGTRIATGSAGGRVQLWNTNGALLSEWLAHTATVRTVAFSGNGQWLASGSTGPLLKIWNSDGSSNRVLLAGASTNQINVLRFSAGTEALAAACADGTVRIWWTSNWSPGAVMAGHTRSVTSLDIAGEWLGTGSSDRTARLWRWRDGTLVRTLEHTNTPANVALFDDGRLLATTSGGVFHFWNTASGNYAGNLVDLGARSIRRLRFSPNSQQFAYARFDNTLAVATAPVVMRSVQRQGDEMVIDWFGPAGTYQAEGALFLHPDAWLLVGEPFTQSPARLNWTEEPVVYFRLRREP